MPPQRTRHTDIKKWTVGSPIQAPLDAIEIIRTLRAFETNELARVTDLRASMRSVWQEGL